MTRRDLLGRAAGGAFGFWAGSAVPRLGAAVASEGVPAPMLSEFGYGEVELADGPLERQVRENHALLLDLNEDSLLRPFRIREGLPASGTELGGWYDTYGFAPGATFGQWVSALTRYWAISPDPATREKVHRLIQGYAATIDPAGKFYVDNRFPSYIYDKLVCGLIDAHTFMGDPAALSVLERTTNAAWNHLPEKAMPRQETPVLHGEDFTRHCWDESYTLPENLFLAWQRTGRRRYLELAKRFLFNEEYFYPLARGENVLPGKHAYSHVNALSSAAQAYLVLGNDTYLRAARNGFAMVEQQSYATGGWGPDEHFFVPDTGKLAASLQSTHSSFETPCGSYAHFKIARYLMRVTRDPRYGDSMERVLYNTILGAKPIQPDGSSFYYSDYNFQAHKFFHPDKWPCCSGTLPQVAADYRISAYFRDARGIHVNLYVPSTVTWKRAGATYSLRQITDYPYSSQIRLEVAASSPATFSVFLRIPEWGDGARAVVSGEKGSRLLAPGTFAEIQREWRSGDRIELELPLNMRLEAVDPWHQQTVALLAGPLVLMPIINGGRIPASRALLLSARQPSAGARIWRTGSGTNALTLKSFMDIHDEAYTVYVDVADAAT